MGLANFRPASVPTKMKLGEIEGAGAAGCRRLLHPIHDVAHEPGRACEVREVRHVRNRWAVLGASSALCPTKPHLSRRNAARTS